MKNANGFTLIELVVVIVIIGILSFIGLATLTNRHVSLEYETMVKRIATDVRFAQQLALSEGRATRVYIDQTNNRYYIKWEDGSYVKEPIGNADFIVQLGGDEFSDVSITGTAFTSGRLDFATTGKPLNAGVVFSNSLSLVTINNAKKITVVANTGFLLIENL
jgi:prepilin-type N-terminal cleavage/methylation domain-containing protein